MKLSRLGCGGADYVRLIAAACRAYVAFDRASVRSHTPAPSPQSSPSRGKGIDRASLVAIESPNAANMALFGIFRQRRNTRFTRAGFKTVVRHVPPRPIMRYDLKAIHP